MGIPYRFDPLGTLDTVALPKGYTRLESVLFSSSGGDRWCCVGPVLDYTRMSELEIDIELAPGPFICGTTNSIDSTHRLYITSAGINNLLPTEDATSLVRYPMPGNARKRFLIDISRGEAFCNGTLIAKCTPPSDDFSVPWFMLGSSGRNPTSGDRCYFRLFGLKAWNSGRLTVHLVPCFDQQGVGCLYCAVRKLTYYTYGGSNPLRP